MMTAAASGQPPEQGRPRLESYELRVSAYDRVSGLLLSMVILVGTVVSVLLIIWLTNQIWARQPAVPVVLEEIGTGEGSLGEYRHLWADIEPDFVAQYVLDAARWIMHLESKR